MARIGNTNSESPRAGDWRASARPDTQRWLLNSSSRRPTVTRVRIRILLAAALVVTNLLILVGPLHAQSNTVSGNLVLAQRIALSPTAVAVITLADRSPSGAGTIIGQQRIDGATGNDAFSVPFDPAAINQKHAYSIVASVIDGTVEYQSLPVPTITGGPSSGLQVPIAVPTYAQPAQVTGTIAMAQKATLSSTAVAYAVIVNVTTGRVVTRQVIPSPSTVPVPFSVTYDASLVSPDDTYGALAAVVDGTTLYQSPVSSPIAAGATVALTVAKTNTVIPGPAASGSPGASGTPGSSVVPSGQPTSPPPSKTPKPSGSEAPTASPTEAPTATPTATPTPSPTAPPSATPTVAPSASPTAIASESAQPSASVAPSASPAAITVTGQVTYKEPATLSPAAVLTIVVVQVDPNGPTVVNVGEQRIDNPGQQPIAFSVPLDPALLVPTSDATLYATLVDGTNAWTTQGGVKVATNGAPTTDVQVPLIFRPDLIEGEVTGAVTNLPSDISLSAWGEAVILNQSDGSVLGLQTGVIHGSTLVPFEVPFLVENVDPTQTYVIVAAVFDDTRTFRSESGVQVITNGTFSGVVLPMVAVNPSPSPTIAATPTAAAPSTAASAAATAAHSGAPVATASPTTPSNTSGGGVDPLLIAGLLGIIVVGVIVVAIVVRR